jgi:hypothetical protein
MCSEWTKMGLARSERFELPTLGFEVSYLYPQRR